MSTAWRLIAVVLVLGAGLVSGCGGDDDEGDAAGGGSEQTAQGGEALDPASAETAEGQVTMCVPKDVSGAYGDTLKIFNEQSDVELEMIELPESADEQRNQQVTRLRAESPECDVYGIDVIWTAEYAGQGWLQDLTEVIEQRRDEFIEATIETARYDERYWAVPYNSNAGFLYYRTDQVDAPPETWQDAYEQAAENDGLVYQGAPYEGLTVDFLELLYSAGGEVLSEDGESAAVDSPETREVLQFMADGIQSGAVPKAVVTYKEEEARRAFEAGRATFMRNWPYAYALGNDAPKIKGKFEITTFPGFGDNPGAGVLGGTNLAISAFSDNPGGALAVVNFYTSGEGQRLIGEGATPPVTHAAYEEPSVREALGLPDEIKAAIDQAKPRPVSPVYPQISQAIYRNVNLVLSGQSDPETAIQEMAAGIDEALATF